MPIVYPYTVCVSDRAKHAHLKLLPREGLIVVIPRGFNRAAVPTIIDRHQRWIENAHRRLADHEKLRGPNQPNAIPHQITLRAIGEYWAVQYTATEAKRITVTEQEGHVLSLEGQDIENPTVCHAVLRGWVRHLAHFRLVLMLQEISRGLGLSYTGVTVRHQRTRWGSCSQRKTISLNQALIFLPPHLTRHVITHELCHTRHLNHSSRFWALVGRHEPNYKRQEKEMRTAWRYVPAWHEPG